MPVLLLVMVQLCGVGVGSDEGGQGPGCGVEGDGEDEDGESGREAVGVNPVGRLGAEEPTDGRDRGEHDYQTPVRGWGRLRCGR